MKPAAFVILAALCALALSSCGANGHITEDEFSARTDAEQEAKERIQYWADVAATLLEDPEIPRERKVELQTAIQETRSALSTYNALRDRGAARTMIMAPITTSATAIVADDVTGAGIADDVLLAPLALAAIATYVITDAAATQQEIGRAWNTTLARVGALGVTVDNVLQFARPGNVADTGIMAEVHELIRANGWKGKQDDICRALAILKQAAENAKDTKRLRRIRATQKYHRCVHSRHKR